MRTPMYEKKDSANKKSTEQRNESSLHNLNFDSGNVKTLTRAEIKEKIQKIFLNLAKFSNVDNQYYISQLTVNKILKESTLVPENPILIGEIDILFKKINPNANRLNCDQFLNFLVKLVQKMFPNEFKKDNVKTVNAFLNDFFDNYDTIINKDDNINLSLPYQTIETIIQYEPDQKQKMVISKLIPTLNEIYIKYFSFELEKNKSLAKKSLQNLISFTRDFEIFPYIINQSQLVIYYNLITQKEINFQFSKKNIGELFTFDKFCIMIIHFSVISYIKNLETKEGEKEEEEVVKLLLFLEALENSKGMKSFMRKLNRPTGNKLSLIPSKKVIYEIFGIKSEESTNETININLSCSSSIISYNSNISLDKLNVSQLYQRISSKTYTELNEIITSNMSSLTKTFLHFCRLGDKLNYNQMTITGYIKFLKNCGIVKKNDSNKERYSTKSKKSNNKAIFGSVENELNEVTKKYLYSENNNKTESNENVYMKPNKSEIINQNESYKKEFNNSNLKEDDNNKKQLSESEIEILFTKITGGSNMKMSYVLFLRSFMPLSHLLDSKTEIGQAIINTLNQYIIPNLISYENTNNEIDNEVGIFKFAFAKLKDNSIKYFLKKFSLSLVTYYKFYCNEKNNMLFDHFYSFFKDFDIFPEMINLIQLRNLFFFLSHNESSQKLISNEDFITFTNLTEAIAICAIICDFEEYYSDIDKLIYVVERMSNSNGMNKCMKQSGRTFVKGKSIDTFLAEIKAEFPMFYNNVNVSYRENMKKILLDKSLSFNDIYGDSVIDNDS